MPNTIQLKTRSTGGSIGAPAALKSAELAYNQADGYLYIGYGDDGVGNATSVKPIGQHDFSPAKYAPAGGLTGQVLKKVSGTDYNYSWQNDEGQVYTASTGLTLTGNAFSVNTTVIATISYVDAGLATKANTSHTHTAADITSGTLDANRIPNLDATKITSGTLDIARMPAALFQAPIVAASNIASLTSPQQALVVAGTTVVTTDGREWRYTGTGTKTLEASYIELADRTPEWSVIANKPSFATVATTGVYTDLTGRPTLGTLAALNSVNNGNWSGTALAVANGGTGGTDAATARTNLGLVIGTNVQAQNATLASLAGLSGVADRSIYYTAANTLALYTLTAFNRTFSAAVDSAAARTVLALGSMATQGANAVAITGGTIDGIIINGGTF